MPRGLFRLFFTFSLLLGIAPATAAVGRIGVILDNSSSEGRALKVVMELAAEDYRNSTGNDLILQFRDSQGDAVQANTAALDLINEQRVQAILGLQTWLETATVAKLGAKSKLPILSFADSSPHWASQQWPILLRVSRNQQTQMRLLAEIIRSWQWRRATIIYEDNDYTATTMIPYVIDSIQQLGSMIDHELALSPFASSYSEELEKLKDTQCRVFIVHASAHLAKILFSEAMKMGMMTEGYVWITTSTVSYLLDSANSSVIDSMQGVIGVKSHAPKIGGAQYTDLCNKFQTRLKLEYPSEAGVGLDVLMLQKYDAVWAVARAMEESTSANLKLLDSIVANNFSGFSGEFRFANGELVAEHVFQILNVVGKSYREMGFWTDEVGFSKSIGNGGNHSSSMSLLGPVFWPGGTWTAPRGWALPTSSNPLKIGVPLMSAFPAYVTVNFDADRNETEASGFSVEVFKAALEYVPYPLHHKFMAFNGTYDSLIEQVYLKVFDAVVGDTSIMSYRCENAEFSQPYTESGIKMVVPVKSEAEQRAWIFTKPFSTSMWALIGIMSLYNTLVLWVIERRSNDDFQGSSVNRISSSLWLSFTSLFANGDKFQNKLSRAVMLVWLFVALFLTACYTASLSSMLTTQQLKPSIIDVETLKRTNAVVGCDGGSSVYKFLQEVLGFHPSNIKQFHSEDDYPPAFENGDIKAAFFKVPYVKMFLAKYCKGFTTAGPDYTYGGFGFVFPKGSFFLPDVSEAVLKVMESGKIQEMQNALISSYNCSSSQDDYGDDGLGPASFLGLFAVMGATSTFVLILFHCGIKDYSKALSISTSIRVSRPTIIESFKEAKQQLEARIFGRFICGEVQMTSIPKEGSHYLGGDLEDSAPPVNEGASEPP